MDAKIVSQMANAIIGTDKRISSIIEEATILNNRLRKVKYLRQLAMADDHPHKIAQATYLITAINQRTQNINH